MAIDVFEVFDRRSDGAHTPPTGPRFEAARTIFAVGVAVAVLVAMCWGVLAVFRGFADGKADVALCTAAQVEDQQAAAAWLGDRANQATGASETQVMRVGCSQSTKSLPVGAMAYLVDGEDLAGAVGVLNDNGCAIELGSDKSGTCETDIDDLSVTVKLAKSTDADAKGDYLWTVTAGAPGA